MQAVILAAGKGTRMSPLSDTRPKPLIPVAGEPFINHVIRRLPKKIDEVVLVVGHQGDMVEKHLGPRFEGRKISYVTQTEQKGSGHALAQAERLITSDFLCLAGDHVWDAKHLQTLSAGKGIIVTGSRVEDISRYGHLQTDGDRLVRILEKPASTEPGLVNVSAYRFTTQIFKEIQKIRPSPRGELELVDAINRMAKDQTLGWLECAQWMDFSLPWHILDANEALMKGMVPDNYGTVEPRATLSGPVRIGKGTRVLNGAYIEGPVVIGNDCLIGPNCYIRACTSIGDGCHIGASTEVKNSVILSRTNIPHHNYVGDSVIGAGCNLGAGTKIANLMHEGTVKMEVQGKIVDTSRKKLGAVLGDGTKTGINTSIYPGRKLGPNSLTDVGAYVSRTVPAGHILMRDGTLKKL